MTSSRANAIIAAGSTARLLPSANPPAAEGVSFPAVTILVLWLGFLVVGLLGLALPYLRPQAHAQPPPPIQAEILNVELTQDALTLPNPEPTPAFDLAQPPPVSELVAPPEALPMISVATPTPVVAFPLPVEGPARVVEPKNADYIQPVAPTAPAPPSPQPITYGHGEGKQPAPDYPTQARRQGQEGTVRVRFSVGENGRVLAAEAIAPSPWPLLNEAALRAVRQRWRFRSGSLRVFEVAIRFELKQ